MKKQMEHSQAKPSSQADEGGSLVGHSSISRLNQ